MTQIRVKLVVALELDVDDHVLEMMEIDDEEPAAAQVAYLRELLEDDKENLSLMTFRELKVVAIEVLEV